MVRSKIRRKKTYYRRKKKSKSKLVIFTILFLIIVSIFSYIFRKELNQYFFSVESEVKVCYYDDFRQHFKDYSVFGIDISQYQKEIQWDKLASSHNIDFAIIRATAGKNHIDSRYKINWHEAEANNIIRGAYHYYRPDENSKEQADFFIKNVVFKAGDLPPILDIEKYSKIQSLTSLKNGLLNWLDIVEEHYGVVPILYTYIKFYNLVIATDPRFDKYPIWLAWYNLDAKEAMLKKTWTFWQFTEQGKISGIDTYVDINIFNGTRQELNFIRIKP